VGGGAGDRTRVEGEVFWKWLDDLVVQRPVDPTDPSSRIGFTNDGIGRAYGAEILVKRDLSRRLYGWIAYTLSRSERASPFQRGGWAPFSSDQTHILTALTGWKVRDGWEVGARFRYTTGNPLTPVQGSVYDSDADVFVPLEGAPASGRIPPFHQLDLRVDRRWEFRSWSLTTYVDVQNVYVRENAEGVRYDYDYDRRFYVTGLPLLPSIGLRGEF
jgi:hypothetical protein